MKHPRLHAWISGWATNIVCYVVALILSWLILTVIGKGELFEYIPILSLLSLFLPFVLPAYVIDPQISRDILKIFSNFPRAAFLTCLGFLLIWWILVGLASAFLDKRYRDRPFYTQSWRRYFTASAFASSLVTWFFLGLVMVLILSNLPFAVR
ncbi:hypothetical protein KBD34_00835 [Patescibacteria group bacterium]|nr:hypothetical protein [Patescibacteria group bacterium]